MSGPHAEHTKPSQRDERVAGLAPIKRLGAFDTPDHVAVALTTWALASRCGPVLDPSFGGCSFLRAAATELGRLGCASPGRLVFGVDLDPARAEGEMRAVQALGVPRSNLLTANFLAVAPAAIDGAPFRAVVGNPPYIRHHWHDSAWQAHAQTTLRARGRSLSKRASAWAYFLLHCVDFIEPGGRMAMVLPGAILHAEYAAQVLDQLRCEFSSLRLIRIRESLFRADEESVVLVADGAGRGPAVLEHAEVADHKALSALLEAPPDSPRLAGQRWKEAALGSEGRALIERVSSHDSTALLGETAHISLGVVTGANGFFVRTPAEVPQHAGVRGRRVVSRAAWLGGALWTHQDVRVHDRAGHATRLISISPTTKPEGDLAAEIRQAVDTQLPDRSHLRRRVPWFSLPDLRVPDAFIGYMGARPRGLVRNDARSLSTNAVHRVWWRNLDPAEQAGIVVASWSTLFAVASELYGRSYGGGILKLELREAQRLPVPVTRHISESDIALLDRRLRAGDTTAARDLADRRWLSDLLNFEDADVAALRRVEHRLRDSRVRSTKEDV